MSFSQRLGIISGSGPDADIDLWRKILSCNKQKMGQAYRGDVDAPYVVIISEPQLGLSMELEKNHSEVWTTLQKSAQTIANHCDYFVIACNTLNYYQHQLSKESFGKKFISFTQVIETYLKQQRIKKAAFLGARSMMEMKTWSPYTALNSIIEIEPFAHIDMMQNLIYDVKRLGVHSTLKDTFKTLLDGIASENIFLACTELPLIADIKTNKRLIDVTELVAEYLLTL